jgi:hypothetical protein
MRESMQQFEQLAARPFVMGEVVMILTPFGYVIN